MKNSKIEWTDHTFNPWIGCTKVSPGCANCYAEADFDKRRHIAKWGKGQKRVLTSTAYWKQPVKWDKECAAAGRRERVFCASLADVFDREVPTGWRDALWHLIDMTTHLDWLLLTKRPEWMVREIARIGLPDNAWLGVSVEDQKRAEERIDDLVETIAKVKFLSVEPLLEPVDLSRWLTDPIKPLLDWVIVGGESGPKARPVKPEWVRTIRDDCAYAGVPFLFKQWGGKNKKAAGRTLDGLVHNAIPEIKTL